MKKRLITLVLTLMVASGLSTPAAGMTILTDNGENGICYDVNDPVNPCDSDKPEEGDYS